jgi:hypothetical protein
MTQPVYRYVFEPSVSMEELEATIVLAIIATESLHGESQTRLDLGHAFDAEKRAVVIEAATDVGRDFNRLFVGFVAREFGRESFQVDRVTTTSEPSTV